MQKSFRTGLAAVSGFLLFIVTAHTFHSCQINEPGLPSWDVGINLPISDKQFNIFDIIERSQNIGIDSSDGNTVFVFGSSDYRREFGEDVKFDGIEPTKVTAPSVFQIDTSLVFDDSTLIRRADFLNGILKFTFNNSSANDYTVSARIGNMFYVQNSDTVSFSRLVQPGKQISVEIPLSEVFILNSKPDNKFRLSMNFNSDQPVIVDFLYELSQYSIRSLEGRMKPLSTGHNYDEVIDPFGSDIPEGELSFTFVVPNTNFLVLRRYNSNYQVDFTNISLVSENKNGNRIRLKYLKHGMPGDPLDSVISLTLPSSTDSLSFPIDQDNSNIIEFINNVPKKILLERTDYINKSYEEGRLNYTDSLSIKFVIQVPLDVSITKPVKFEDTVDVGIDDSELREQMDKLSNMKLSMTGRNGIPLKGIVKAVMLDSSLNPILPLSFLIGGNADSTLTIGAARVDEGGFSSSPGVSSFVTEIGSEQIQKLKSMGKIALEYRLYTDPELIVPPRTSIRIRSSDVADYKIFGNLKYRLDP